MLSCIVVCILTGFLYLHVRAQYCFPYLRLHLFTESQNAAIKTSRAYSGDVSSGTD